MNKVSVYIPCYNAEKYIVRSVESLLMQTIQPDEILIIDDGCTDKSIELIRDYPVKIISMGKNQGLAAVRNRAFQEVKNELVACIDADCSASPTWLEEITWRLPFECAGSGGKTVELNQNNRADRWRARHMPLHWGERRLLNPKVIYGANQVFRKTAVMKVLPLDTTKVADDYKIGFEDIELTQKLYRAGYKLIYNPDALVYHLRTDTAKGIIRQYWRWSVFYYPEPKNLPLFFLKVIINFLKALKHVGDDIMMKEYQLITISLMIFPWHTYFDWKHLRRIRSNMTYLTT